MGVYLWTDRRAPSSNTVAYRPLNSSTTVYDKSGNNYTLTKVDGSFTTIGDVDCFYNGGGNTGYLYTETAPIPSGGTDRTISFWAMITATTDSENRRLLMYGNTGTDGADIDFGYTAGTPPSHWLSIVGTTINGANVQKNIWCLHTVVVSNGVLTYYINGVSQGNTGGATINTQAVNSSYPFTLMRLRPSTSGYQTRGYMSEVIVESMAWDNTTLTNYFNDNKAKYGLS